MRPIGKYLAVSPIEEEIKTESGLLLSANDVADLRYKKAKVLAPGTDVTAIKAGDVIYFDKRSGFTMVIDGEKLTIITERDVVVVL
jgi:co-chaperonin GroES (HSP10)